MSEYRIAVIPGDGVGPEISKAATKVADAAVGQGNVHLTWHWFDWGCDYYLKHNMMMPRDGLDILSSFDAIFLGCIGDASKVPDHISLGLLLSIRKGFQQYINLRPIYLYDGVETQLKTAGAIDLVVVRENVEGEYAQIGGRLNRASPDEVAIQTAVFTRKGTERVIRYAFRIIPQETQIWDWE